MQHPETDTGPFGSHWGEKEQTAFAHVPLMTKTVLSQYLEVLASEGNCNTPSRERVQYMIL